MKRVKNKNDFMNAYAVQTIVASASEIIHNLLPMETNHNVEEMQETTFTGENARLINDIVDLISPPYIDQLHITKVYKGGEK